MRRPQVGAGGDRAMRSGEVRSWAPDRVELDQNAYELTRRWVRLRKATRRRAERPSRNQIRQSVRSKSVVCFPSVIVAVRPELLLSAYFFGIFM